MKIWGKGIVNICLQSRTNIDKHRQMYSVRLKAENMYISLHRLYEWTDRISELAVENQIIRIVTIDISYEKNNECK